MKKLLLIEDNALVRETTLDWLEVENFEVISAENGLVGLELAREQHPDLIISDIVMPEMDGYELLSALRQQPLTADIPFIFLSAKAEKADKNYALRAGADNYLVKPFNLVELLNVIEICLQQDQKKD
jgi:CheY-like chemotaxis protein